MTEPPRELQGWIGKETIVIDADLSRTGLRRYLLLQPIVVLGFFIRRGHILLVPVVILLMILGLILFFVQTSALAPFIYTLF